MRKSWIIAVVITSMMMGITARADSGEAVKTNFTAKQAAEAAEAEAPAAEAAEPEAAAAPAEAVEVEGEAVVVAEGAAEEEPAAEARTREQFDGNKALHKAGRGMANILTCVFEIPKQMFIQGNRHDSFAGSLGGTVVGIPVGIGWGVYRLGAGLCDLVTAPFPLPTYDNCPIDPATIY